jgi:hypothetical protein
MRCPSCQTTFVVDRDGNCLTSSNEAIVAEQNDPREAPVLQQQGQIPEDEFSQICGDNDLDPVLLKKIIDPRSLNRFSRPLLVGFFLTFAVGVVRIIVYELNDGANVVEVAFQSFMLSMLFGVMNGVFLTLLVAPSSANRQSNQDGLAPYLWMALVWFVLSWLIYQHSHHSSPINEALQFAPFMLFVATLLCWVVSLVGLVFRGWGKRKDSDIHGRLTDRLAGESDANESSHQIRQSDPTEAITPPESETKIKTDDSG